MTAEQCPSMAEELVRAGHLNQRGKPWRDRTHCGLGHPYTPENVYMRPHGARRCKRCESIRNAEWYVRRGKELRRARRQESS